MENKETQTDITEEYGLSSDEVFQNMLYTSEGIFTLVDEAELED